MATSTVTTSRTVLAEGLVNRGSTTEDVFIAFGSGNPLWDSTQTLTQAFLAAPVNTLTIGQTYLQSVIVQSADQLTTFTEGQDYTVDLNTGIITRLGDGIIGDGSTVYIEYDLSKTPLTSQTQLISEIARKRPTVLTFLTPNSTGAIETSIGNFDITTTPTRFVLARLLIDATEASGETIREFGLFANCVLDSGLPLGQVYFEPADVTDIGDALMFNIVESPLDKDVLGSIGLDFVFSV